MKNTMIGLMTVALAATAFGAEKAELDQRIHSLTSKFEAMQHQPDKMIPADRLASAQGVVLLDRSKSGEGVALVKDAKTGEWSPGAFVRAEPASLGAPGGEQGFSVVLLMNPAATRMLSGPTAGLGNETQITGADPTPGAPVPITRESGVLVYDDAKGLNPTAAVKNGTFTPDNAANQAYYDGPVNLKDILFDKRVKPADASKELASKINEFSKNTKL
jgi:lipid-binding SYLF domain-containing protein